MRGRSTVCNSLRNTPKLLSASASSQAPRSPVRFPTIFQPSPPTRRSVGERDLLKQQCSANGRRRRADRQRHIFLGHLSPTSTARPRFGRESCRSYLGAVPARSARRSSVRVPRAAALLRAFEFLSQGLGQPSAQLG